MTESPRSGHHLRHVAPDIPGGAPLLQPGLTCWRVERAARLAPIVDAAPYFRLVRDALLRARHSVLFIGWEFDTRIKLDPDTPLPGLPDRLGPFLSALVERRPELCVRVLQWNLGLIGTLLRGTTPLYVLNWITSKRFQFRLDSAHPPGAAHHQKIVVIDDALAFCGGIDMTDDRWDTRDHKDGDPRRVRPSGRAYGAFHDATMAVEGPAAAALGELARERWRRATGEQIEPPPAANPDLWPEGLAPLLCNVEVGIARTEPEYHGRTGVREIEALHLAAIATARQVIYIEGQYFAARCVGEALAARLREPDGPEIVVINSQRARGWVEEKAMGGARQRLLAYLREADRYGRFRIYRPVTADGAPIYVHAKVLAIDDRLLRIGSANLNNRSMGLDTECDLAVEAHPGAPDAKARSRAVTTFRNELLAEHLATSPDTVAAALLRTEGSLVRAMEALRRGSGRTLMPIEMPIADATPLGDGELLDPEQAEPIWSMAVHVFQDRFAWMSRG
ncbi:phospholipase D-like domain-containing protein [Methylobacterium isbiliense]|uniref:Phospholipase D n=1 Tax=Methylobacterium isbiliense TaxID=315478 RepID=A0ABQ4SA67_9HYPH|nr:phospholipase D-like domain-containing protein [Methylobacterium isbiliense]MDN3626945.1 phospholipase D-like domain-containing protein [Methylobacterium isbiliense]GJD98759.1 Cardiolipin synthase B [Methylobacterium isbiliense]